MTRPPRPEPPDPAVVFARYRPLVDDWPAFLEALGRPLPRCAWPHPERMDGKALASALVRCGLDPEPLGWLAGAYRLPAESRPGASVEFAVGGFHVQEEAALVPVALLDPQPGERILDLCAAPGGKALATALRLGPGGTLVANDLVSGRLAPLRFHMNRLGAANVVLTRWDASSYPRAAGAFDRVLADVPCTCEGTSRKSPEVLARAGVEEAERMSRIQVGILSQAVRCCRPGGRIVYATCTYAPEENEAVVDQVVRAFGEGALEILPAGVPGLVAAAGLEAWGGRRFVRGMGNALRLWPHFQDTGGFFVAVLRKAEDGPGRHAEAPAPPRVADSTLFKPTLERFGLGIDDLGALRPVVQGRRKLALAPEALRPPGHPRPEVIGLPFLRLDVRRRKLATPSALVLGPRARRHTVALDAADAAAFVARATLDWRPQWAAPAAPGWWLATHGGLGLGVGEVAGAAPEPRLTSNFPKAWVVAAAEG